MALVVDENLCNFISGRRDVRESIDPVKIEALGVSDGRGDARDGRSGGNVAGAGGADTVNGNTTGEK